MKKHISTVAIFIWAIYLQTCVAYRILGVFPMPGKSHYFLGGTLMKALADAGHDVTTVTPFIDDYTPKSNGSWNTVYLDGHVEYMTGTYFCLFYK